MEPISPSSSEEHDAAWQVAADLAAPLPPPPALPTERPLSLLASESAIQELLQVVVQRMDQVARLNQEQWQSGQATLQEMRDTMELAQEFIASQEQQQQQQAELLGRLEVAIQALIKINSNLSQIVAALVA